MGTKKTFQKKGVKKTPIKFETLEELKKKLQELESFLEGSLNNWSYKSLEEELNTNFVRGNEVGLARCRAEFKRRELIDSIAFLTK